MAYRRNFRPMPVPTKFPASISFRSREFNFDFVVESLDALEAFKMNKLTIDRVAGVFKNFTSDQHPVTAAEIENFLRENKLQFRPKFEADEKLRVCFRCGRENQPVVTVFRFRDRETGEEKEIKGGNFRGMSEEKIKKYSDVLVQRANEYTAEIFDGVIPDNLFSRLVEVCPLCKKEEDGVEIRRSRVAQKEVEKAQSRKASEEELDQIRREFGDTRPHFQRDFNLSQAKEKLLDISARIQNVISDKETDSRKRAFDENLGRRSRRPQTEDGRGGSFRGRREDRPRKEKRDWNGVDLEIPTADRADQLVAEGVLENTLDALVELSEQQIVDFGLVEFPEQAPHVRLILLGAKKRQEEANEVSRVAGSGTAPLGEVAKEHTRREKSQGDGRGGKKFREPRRNPKYDYNR